MKKTIHALKHFDTDCYTAVRIYGSVNLKIRQNIAFVYDVSIKNDTKTDIVIYSNKTQLKNHLDTNGHLPQFTMVGNVAENIKSKKVKMVVDNLLREAEKDGFQKLKKYMGDHVMSGGSINIL